MNSFESPTESKQPDRPRDLRIMVLGPRRVGKTSIVNQFVFDQFHSDCRPTTTEEMYRTEFDIVLHSPERHISAHIFSSSQLSKKTEIPVCKVTFDIQDVAGDYLDEFPAMANLSIAAADAFIIVFSLADAESWDEVSRIRTILLDKCGKKVEDKRDSGENSSGSITTNGSAEGIFNFSTQTSLDSDFSDTNDGTFSKQEPIILIVGNKSDLVEAEYMQMLRNSRQTPTTHSSTSNTKAAMFELIATFDWECGYAECSAKTKDNVNAVFYDILRRAGMYQSHQLSASERRADFRQASNSWHGKSRKHSEPLTRKFSQSDLIRMSSMRHRNSLPNSMPGNRKMSSTVYHGHGSVPGSMSNCRTVSFESRFSQGMTLSSGSYSRQSTVDSKYGSPASLGGRWSRTKLGSIDEHDSIGGNHEKAARKTSDESEATSGYCSERGQESTPSRRSSLATVKRRVSRVARWLGNSTSMNQSVDDGDGVDGIGEKGGGDHGARVVRKQAMIGQQPFVKSSSLSSERSPEKENHRDDGSCPVS